MTDPSNSLNPVSVKVVYCSVCDYGGKCLHLAKLVKEQAPNAQVVCTKGKQGSFEVFINDVQVYSKLQTMALPEYDEVVTLVKSVSEGGPIVPIKTSQPIDCVIV